MVDDGWSRWVEPAPEGDTAGHTNTIEHVALQPCGAKDEDRANDGADGSHVATAAGNTSETDNDAPKASAEKVELRPDDDAIHVEATVECPAGVEEITESVTIMGTFYASVTQVDGVKHDQSLDLPPGLSSLYRRVSEWSVLYST